MKIKLLLLSSVIILIIYFAFFIPISSYKGLAWRGNSGALTCQGYLTPDGLPPGIDQTHSYHLLLGQLRAYRQYQIPPDLNCFGDLKTVKAKLYL